MQNIKIFIIIILLLLFIIFQTLKFKKIYKKIYKI